MDWPLIWPSLPFVRPLLTGAFVRAGERPIVMQIKREKSFLLPLGPFAVADDDGCVEYVCSPVV